MVPFGEFKKLILWRVNCKITSCLPPEQARDRGVSLVLSDWASMSPPLSSRISTTPTWPAVAARIRGVNPVHRQSYTQHLCKFTIPTTSWIKWRSLSYPSCPGARCWPHVQWALRQALHGHPHRPGSVPCHDCSQSEGRINHLLKNKYGQSDALIYDVCKCSTAVILLNAEKMVLHVRQCPLRGTEGAWRVGRLCWWASVRRAEGRVKL